MVGSDRLIRGCGLCDRRDLQVQRDVHDHVFLTTDETAGADLDEEGAHVDAIPRRSCLGVTEEARVDTRVSERESSPSTRTGLSWRGRTRSSAASCHSLEINLLTV